MLGVPMVCLCCLYVGLLVLSSVISSWIVPVCYFDSEQCSSALHNACNCSPIKGVCHVCEFLLLFKDRYM